MAQGLKKIVPQLMTNCAAIPGRILYLCQNCWHNPTTQSDGILSYSAIERLRFYRDMASYEVGIRQERPGRGILKAAATSFCRKIAFCMGPTGITSIGVLDFFR